MKFDITEIGYTFWCPGCNTAHGFDSRWGISGTPPNITVTSSLLSQGLCRCHLHINNGKLVYGNDCEHELKNQTVDIPEWPYKTDDGKLLP